MVKGCFIKVFCKTTPVQNDHFWVVPRVIVLCRFDCTAWICWIKYISAMLGLQLLLSLDPWLTVKYNQSCLSFSYNYDWCSLNWLNWFCPLPLISGLETTIGYWILTVGNAILSHRAFLLSDKMTNTKIFEKFVWNSFFSFIEHLKWESFCTKLILTNLDWIIYWMIYTGSYLNILFLNFKLVELAQPCSSYKCYTLLRHSSNITALRLGISVAYRLGL